MSDSRQRAASMLRIARVESSGWRALECATVRSAETCTRMLAVGSIASAVTEAEVWALLDQRLERALRMAVR